MGAKSEQRIFLKHGLESGLVRLLILVGSSGLLGSTPHSSPPCPLLFLVLSFLLPLLTLAILYLYNL